MAHTHMPVIDCTNWLVHYVAILTVGSLFSRTTWRRWWKMPLKITKEEGGNNKNGYAKVRTYPRQVWKMTCL